jgi:hypothetical protein
MTMRKRLIDRKDIRACGGPVRFVKQRLHDWVKANGRKLPERIVVSDDMLMAMHHDSALRIGYTPDLSYSALNGTQRFCGIQIGIDHELSGCRMMLLPADSLWWRHF